RLADAAALPLEDGSADLAIAFMSLHDIDDTEGAIAQLARILQPGGKLCVALAHPFGTAGEFAGPEADSPFIVSGSYVEPFRYRDLIERDRLRMTFESVHRPLHWYFERLADAGFLVERVREVTVPDAAATEPHHRRWQRIPLFLHIRALRP